MKEYKVLFTSGRTTTISISEDCYEDLASKWVKQVPGSTLVAEISGILIRFDHVDAIVPKENE